MKYSHRYYGLRWSALLLAMAIAAAAPAASLTVALPTGVQLTGFTQSQDSMEVHLSQSALSAGLDLPTGASLRVNDGECIVSIPRKSSSISFRLGDSTDSAVQITFNASSGGNPSIAAAGSQSLVTDGSAPSSTISSASSAFSLPTSSSTALVASNPAQNTAIGNVPDQQQQQSPENVLLSKVELSDLAKLAAKLPDAVNFNRDPISKTDFAIPVSPAAAALGATSSLLRPATPKQTVTDILTNFDEDGKLNAGFSVGITPYTMLRGSPLTATEYRNNQWIRFLANTQISAAGLPAADGNTNSRYSVGLSFLFFDEGDLRLDEDLLNLIGRVFHRPLPPTLPGQLAPDANFSDTQFTQASGFWNEKQAKNWNAASAGLGLAPMFESPSGKLSDFKSDGTVAWINLALPGPGRLSKNTQFILGGNARFSQLIDMNGVMVEGDVYDMATQLRFGSPHFNGFAEASYRSRKSSITSGSSEDFVYEIGLEKRLSQGLWLNLSWSNDDAVTGGETIKTGLRYGFGDKAVLPFP